MVNDNLRCGSAEPHESHLYETKVHFVIDMYPEKSKKKETTDDSDDIHRSCGKDSKDS